MGLVDVVVEAAALVVRLDWWEIAGKCSPSKAAGSGLSAAGPLTQSHEVPVYIYSYQANHSLYMNRKSSFVYTNIAAVIPWHLILLSTLSTCVSVSVCLLPH